MYCSIEIITEFSPNVCASVCVSVHMEVHMCTPWPIKAIDHHWVITVEASTLFYEIASLTWAWGSQSRYLLVFTSQNIGLQVWPYPIASFGSGYQIQVFVYV